MSPDHHQPATLQDVAEFRLTDMEDWLVSLIRQETLNNPVSDFHLRHLIAKKDCIQKAIYERRQLREQLESAIAEKERLAGEAELRKQRAITNEAVYLAEQEAHGRTAGERDELVTNLGELCRAARKQADANLMESAYLKCVRIDAESLLARLKATPPQQAGME
jgi:hypothetical protein